MFVLINTDNSISYASNEPVSFKHGLTEMELPEVTHLVDLETWAFCFYDPDTNTVISMSEYIAKYPEQFPDE